LARAAISLTTTGTSGAATYNNTTGVLNIPQYQTALTNPVTGTGTTNYLPKFTGASTIGNSAITDDGTTVTLLSRALVGTSGTFSGLLSGGNSSPSTSYNAGSWFTGDGLVAGNISSVCGIQINSSSTSTLSAIRFGDGDGANNLYDQGFIIYRHTTDSMLFGTNRGTALTINASGNLGLGVTPSAWGSGQISFDFGTLGSLSTDGSSVVVQNNRYFNGTSNIYKANGHSTLYSQGAGAHVWYNAPSGTAGNAISFTQAMTLDASGRLGIGTTSPATLLHISSIGNTFLTIDGGASSNTGVTFYKGGSAAGAIYYLGATNVMRFDVNNAELMRLNASGNLSIGNTNDTYKLDVSGTSMFRGDLTLDSAGSDKKIYFRSTGGNPDTNWSMGNLLTPTGATVVTLAATVIDVFNGAGYGFMVRNTSNAPLLQIAGNTGAATFSSTANRSILFDTTNANGVYATWQKSGADEFYIGRSNGVGGGAGFYDFYANAAGGGLRFFTNGAASPSLLINTSGNVGIGTTTIDQKFVVQGPANNWTGNFIGSTTTGQSLGLLVTAGTNSSDWAFYVQNSSSTAVRMVVRGDGNVGIGTTSPSATLHVNGTLQTAAPANGTAQPWKLGNAVSGTVSPSHYLVVEINGQSYTINAFNGFP